MAPNVSFWEGGAPANQPEGRIYLQLPLFNQDSQGRQPPLPTPDIPWSRVLAWMDVLSLGGTLDMAFCGRVQAQYRTHLLTQAGDLSPRLAPLRAQRIVPEDLMWVAGGLGAIASKFGGMLDAHLSSLNYIALRHASVMLAPLRVKFTHPG